MTKRKDASADLFKDKETQLINENDQVDVQQILAEAYIHDRYGERDVAIGYLHLVQFILDLRYGYEKRMIIERVACVCDQGIMVSPEQSEAQI